MISSHQHEAHPVCCCQYTKHTIMEPNLWNLQIFSRNFGIFAAATPECRARKKKFVRLASDIKAAHEARKSSDTVQILGLVCMQLLLGNSAGAHRCLGPCQCGQGHLYFCFLFYLVLAHAQSCRQCYVSSGARSRGAPPFHCTKKKI